MTNLRVDLRKGDLDGVVLSRSLVKAALTAYKTKRAEAAIRLGIIMPVEDDLTDDARDLIRQSKQVFSKKLRLV